MGPRRNVESTGKSPLFSRSAARVRILSTPGNTSRLLDILKRASFKVAHLVSSFIRSVSSLNVTSQDAMRKQSFNILKVDEKMFLFLICRAAGHIASAILSAGCFIDSSPQFSVTFV